MTGKVAALWTAAKSAIALAVAAALGSLLESGKTDVFSISLDDVRVYIAAGVAIALPVIITALNPNDDRYGIGAVKK